MEHPRPTSGPKKQISKKGSCNQMYDNERDPKYEESTDSRGKGGSQKGQKRSNNRRRNNRRNGNRNNRDFRGDPSANSVARGIYAGTAPGKNDLSWYTKNPDLVAVASRIAMPYRPGNAIDLGAMTINGSYNVPFDFNGIVTVPGVMSLEFTPTVGHSDDTLSPISICATRMWSQIRSKFSSDLVVDPPDIFMYIYAIGQIHAYIEMLKRMYRTINTFSSDNYDFPRNVFKAQFPDTTFAINDQDFHEFLAYKPQMVVAINEMVNAINVFRVPDQYPILHRMRWMNMHVYMDENRSNAQCFVFRQKAFYCVDDTGDDGTVLTPVVPLASWRFDDYIEAGWTMIRALTNWEDAYTINGYIARAWEGSPALLESLLAELEILAPVYVPEVLMQIENANINTVNFDTGVPFTPPDITQDPATGAVLCDMTGITNMRYSRGLINLHEDTSDAAAIIATRLTSMPYTIANDPDPFAARLICGSEIINNVRIIYGGAPGERYDQDVCPSDGVPIINLAADACSTDVKCRNIAERLLVWRKISYWHHHPMIYPVVSKDDFDPGQKASSEEAWFRVNSMVPICDLDQITVYDNDWLSQLHRVVFYSLFNVFNKDDVIKRGG